MNGRIPASLLDAGSAPVPGAPASQLTLRPGSPGELAETLGACSASGISVLVWGGGSHQGMGHAVAPDVVLSTERLSKVVDHQAEDMTLVVEGGVSLAAISGVLDPYQQMAILPETVPGATIGGVIAAGVSGYRRGRYGPTRDHLLEVTLATGDGRIVRAGGRVVKNVQGYDLMRLSAGSFGSLGVIVQACLKLWPRPARSATVAVCDASAALAGAFRPWAVLETEEGCRVHLAGTSEEIDAQVARLDGVAVEGHDWPSLPGDGPAWSVRVPPAATADAVQRIPNGVPLRGPAWCRCGRLRRRRSRGHPGVGRSAGRIPRPPAR